MSVIELLITAFFGWIGYHSGKTFSSSVAGGLIVGCLAGAFVAFALVAPRQFMVCWEVLSNKLW